MKALFELFRRFDARRIFGYIRRLGGMSRPKVKCYDLRSTRALRVEGDGRAGFFLPKASRISIRALRVEGDPALFRLPISFPNFYPRPPGGGRLRVKLRRGGRKKFLSTPSGWRATTGGQFFSFCHCISIHALRVEGDSGTIYSEVRCARISIHALRVEGD